MGIDYTNNTAYGLLVEAGPDIPYWDLYELQPSDSRVVVMMAGAYDEDQPFLVIRETWKKVEAGHPVLVPPYQGTDEQYLTWDAALVSAAEELKLNVAIQPGWMFVPDES